MEWWVTLLISLASAVVSAIVTGFFTLGIERRKQGRIELQKHKEELQKQYEERPRLELKKFGDITIIDDDDFLPRCPECGELLSDNGECPYCKEGERHEI